MTAGVTVVLPSIYLPYTEACVRSMGGHRVPYGTHLVTVRNKPQGGPSNNLGVAGSWNEGIRNMVACDDEWLLIVSAAVRFEPGGFGEFIEGLSVERDYPHGIRAVEADNGLGWHLIAFHREVIDRVGWFDENFYPAYFEDNDYSYRAQLAFGVDSRLPDFAGPLWPKVPARAAMTEVAHGITRGHVPVDFVGLEAYYVRKWGGKSGAEVWTNPGDGVSDFRWWPTVDREGRHVRYDGTLIESEQP